MTEPPVISDANPTQPLGASVLSVRPSSTGNSLGSRRSGNLGVGRKERGA
jgi:hypothetical protein